jgi:hypothetical protein
MARAVPLCRLAARPATWQGVDSGIPILGQMLIAASKAGKLGRDGRPSKKPVEGDDRFILDEVGISKDLSSRAQRLAEIDSHDPA